MPKAVMIVYSRPSEPSRDEEYNDWYDNIHLAEVCAVPGIVSARRYQLSGTQLRDPDPARPEYVAIYELDADDLQASLDELTARVGDGTIQVTDALQQNPRAQVTVYEERKA